MRRVTDERAQWLARHVLPHEPALRNWLRSRTVPGLEVDDVVHETYAILASLEQVDAIRNPRTYAFQVAHSVVLRQVRRSRIVSMRAMSDLNDFDVRADQPSPEQEAIDRDALHHLAEAIAALPGRTRQAFVLRRVEGLSQREIARRMGVSENTVEKHIARGIRHLMNRLGRGGNEGAGASKVPERGFDRQDVKARGQSGD